MLHCRFCCCIWILRGLCGRHLCRCWRRLLFTVPCRQVLAQRSNLLFVVFHRPEFHERGRHLLLSGVLCEHGGQIDMFGVPRRLLCCRWGLYLQLLSGWQVCGICRVHHLHGLCQQTVVFRRGGGLLPRRILHFSLQLELPFM